MLRDIAILISLLLFVFQSSGQDTATFRKEIPTWANIQPDLFYSLTGQKAKQLHLDDLETGFDSIQIRVWLCPALRTYRQLYTIQKDQNGWSGWRYDMEVDWDARKLTDTVKKHTKEKLKPKTDWNAVAQKLIDRKITTLPDMDDIAGIWFKINPETGDTMINMVMDGITYCFEVATSDSYRFYSYGNPKHYQGDFWQARNVIEIIDILKTEFVEEKKKKRKTRTHNNR